MNHHPDFNQLKTIPERVGFMTIAEFWNNAGWGDCKFPFRVTLSLRKPQTGEAENFFFASHGQKLPVDQDGVPTASSGWSKGTLWDEVSPVAVPVGKWFEMEVYPKEGDQRKGRVLFSIKEAGQAWKTVLDVTNYTHHPEATVFDGFRELNPIKLYTNAMAVNYVRDHGGALRFYWDDFKFWKGDARLPAAAPKSSAITTK